MSTSIASHGEAVSFTAFDGTSLAGMLFRPDGGPHTALLINSGTGIPQRFYARFARHAAARGFVVLTFDYRGIGGSAPESLRGYEARYRDWGQRDVPGAIRWLDEHYPTLPLTVVGHSTGGQQLGLAQNVERVRAAVFIAVSTGYWRGMPARQKWLTLGLWKVYLPFVSRLYGYAPVRKLRLGENLPTGVAREWGAWCLEPDYFAAYFDDNGRYESFDGRPFGPIYFKEATFPIWAYYFTDDPIATQANVPPLLTLYERAEVQTHWVSPEALGVQGIGHLGFFHSGIGAGLWDDVLSWLQEQGAANSAI